MSVSGDRWIGFVPRPSKRGTATSSAVGRRLLRAGLPTPDVLDSRLVRLYQDHAARQERFTALAASPTARLALYYKGGTPGAGAPGSSTSAAHVSPPPSTLRPRPSSRFSSSASSAGSGSVPPLPPPPRAYVDPLPGLEHSALVLEHSPISLPLSTSSFFSPSSSLTTPHTHSHAHSHVHSPAPPISRLVDQAFDRQRPLEAVLRPAEIEAELAHERWLLTSSSSSIAPSRPASAQLGRGLPVALSTLLRAGSGHHRDLDMGRVKLNGHPLSGRPHNGNQHGSDATASSAEAFFRPASATLSSSSSSSSSPVKPSAFSSSWQAPATSAPTRPRRRAASRPGTAAARVTAMSAAALSLGCPPHLSAEEKQHLVRALTLAYRPEPSRVFPPAPRTLTRAPTRTHSPPHTAVPPLALGVVRGTVQGLEGDGSEQCQGDASADPAFASDAVTDAVTGFVPDPMNDPGHDPAVNAVHAPASNSVAADAVWEEYGGLGAPSSFPPAAPVTSLSRTTAMSPMEWALRQRRALPSSDFVGPAVLRLQQHTREGRNAPVPPLPPPLRLEGPATRVAASEAAAEAKRKLRPVSSSSSSSSSSSTSPRSSSAASSSSSSSSSSVASPALPPSLQVRRQQAALTWRRRRRQAAQEKEGRRVLAILARPQDPWTPLLQPSQSTQQQQVSQQPSQQSRQGSAMQSQLSSRPTSATTASSLLSSSSSSSSSSLASPSVTHRAATLSAAQQEQHQSITAALVRTVARRVESGAAAPASAGDVLRTAGLGGAAGLGTGDGGEAEEDDNVGYDGEESEAETQRVAGKGEVERGAGWQRAGAPVPADEARRSAGQERERERARMGGGKEADVAPALPAATEDYTGMSEAEAVAANNRAENEYYRDTRDTRETRGTGADRRRPRATAARRNRTAAAAAAAAETVYVIPPKTYTAWGPGRGDTFFISTAPVGMSTPLSVHSPPDQPPPRGAAGTRAAALRGRDVAPAEDASFLPATLHAAPLPVPGATVLLAPDDDPETAESATASATAPLGGAATVPARLNGTVRKATWNARVRSLAEAEAVIPTPLLEDRVVRQVLLSQQMSDPVLARRGSLAGSAFSSALAFVRDDDPDVTGVAGVTGVTAGARDNGADAVPRAYVIRQLAPVLNAQADPSALLPELPDPDSPRYRAARARQLAAAAAASSSTSSSASSSAAASAKGSRPDAAAMQLLRAASRAPEAVLDAVNLFATTEPSVPFGGPAGTFGRPSSISSTAGYMLPTGAGSTVGASAGPSVASNSSPSLHEEASPHLAPQHRGSALGGVQMANPLFSPSNLLANDRRRSRYGSNGLARGLSFGPLARTGSLGAAMVSASPASSSSSPAKTPGDADGAVDQSPGRATDGGTGKAAGSGMARIADEDEEDAESTSVARQLPRARLAPTTIDLDRLPPMESPAAVADPVAAPSSSFSSSSSPAAAASPFPFAAESTGRSHSEEGSAPASVNIDVSPWADPGPAAASFLSSVSSSSFPPASLAPSSFSSAAASASSSDALSAARRQQALDPEERRQAQKARLAAARARMALRRSPVQRGGEGVEASGVEGVEGTEAGAVLSAGPGVGVAAGAGVGVAAGLGTGSEAATAEVESATVEGGGGVAS